MKGIMELYKDIINSKLLKNNEKGLWYITSCFTQDDDRCATKEEKYKGIPIDVLLKTECLKDCVERVLQIRHDSIIIDILSGKMLLLLHMKTHFNF